MALADGIDLLCETMFSSFSRKASKIEREVNRSTTQSAIGLAYIPCMFIWCVVAGQFSNMDFSALVTGASFVQCMGFLLLNVKVQGYKSVSGVSSKSLVLYLIHYCARLASTTLRNGYVPVDKSGDGPYQLIDFCSLVLVLILLFKVHKTHRATHQTELDSLAIWPLVAVSAVLAANVHANLVRSLFFDVCWTFSSYVETVALVPQLWMLARAGGTVDGLTAHFVACTVASGVLTFTFWWFTFPQMDKRGGFAGKLLISLHGFKLFLGADFMYYYTRAWFGGTSVTLPDALDV